MKRLLPAALALPGLLTLTLTLTVALAPSSAVSAPYTETFSGAPGSPQPWTPGNWDVSVHSRDVATWDRLDPMDASHGGDCAGPPATHTVQSYADAVFLCRDHMMTSIHAEGYGLIYVTPDRQVDFSAGEAVVRFDVSTLRSSGRDWWDLWITPYEDNVQLALDAGLPDLSGPPRRAIHIKMDFGDNKFIGELYDNFEKVADLGGPDQGVPYDAWLTPDAAHRDTFELRVSTGRVQFGMPAYNRRWVDASLPGLDWNQGVVQFGHHSYTPTKDCFGTSPCQPGTWHWDNVTIDPALPFTMLRADQRAVAASTGSTVRFPAPAPPGTNLRFAGIGTDLSVSTDGGATWRPATQQRQAIATPTEHFASYWMSVPPGTTEVRFRGQAWWGGGWRARDISLWANNGVSSGLGSTPLMPQGVSRDVTPLNPSRLLDTRAGAVTADGQSAGTGAPGAGNTVELAVAGRGGVPAGAPAVILNVTATGAQGAGYLTVYPCDAPVPVASNLNYSPGRDVANAVLTKVGPGGRVCIYTGVSTTEIVADVSGYFPNDASYSSINPARLLDTRPGGITIDGGFTGTGAVGAGVVKELQVTGRGGVPADAPAVVLNVTATETGGNGYLTVYPCDAPFPLASNLNYSRRDDVANAVVTQVGTGGRVCIYSGAAATHVVADVSGYFPAESGYIAINPSRLLDSRPGAITSDDQYAGIGAPRADDVVELIVAGRAGVPTDAPAVVLNVTATGAEGDGYLTVYPCDASFPLASNLNFSAGRDVANAVLTKVGAGGRVCIYTGAAGTEIVADVGGYFPADGSPLSLRSGAAVTELAEAEPYVCTLPAPSV